MNVREIYTEAIKGRHKSLMLMVQYLVYEKKAVTMEDSKEKFEYFLQDKFKNAMNKYLSEYEDKANGQTRPAAN